MSLIGLMRPIGHISLTLISLIGLMGLMGCSDDQESEKRRVTVELMPCASSYVETITRSWTPPTNYYLYEDLNDLFVGQYDLTDKTIGIYFTQDGETPELGRFLYSGGKWRSTLEVDGGQTYYLYGFIPYLSNGVTASIAPNTTNYSDGAVLTLNGLPTVTPNDVCVVVGAKNGLSAENDNGLKTGQFAYEASGGSGNYIFLLFDHIYSALKFSIKVDATYNTVRTIKLKKMEIEAYVKNNNTTTTVRAKSNVTITLAKTANGSSPITDITFAYDESSDQVKELLFKNDAGTALTTTAQQMFASFVPKDITEFKLISTYDVYDTKGNLIRENCSAENTIGIKKLFEAAGETALIRGRMYVINLTVSPTYLYVLSDPDLDNPTVTIE